MNVIGAELSSFISNMSGESVGNYNQQQDTGSKVPTWQFGFPKP